MKVTAIIVYPAAASCVVEPSGRKVWEPDASPTPWVKVGTEVIDVPEGNGPGVIAERMFCLWNRGSGEESEAFLAAGRRSLSCGDMVVIPEMESALRCGSFGWDVVDCPVAEAILDDGEDTMDFDYTFRSRKGV